MNPENFVWYFIGQNSTQSQSYTESAPPLIVWLLLGTAFLILALQFVLDYKRYK